MTLKHLCAGLCFLLLAGTSIASAQPGLLKTPRLNQIQPGTMPPSNSVSHVLVHRADVWIGTGKGLARSTDSGQSWETFTQDPAFARPGIYAVAALGDMIWASMGYSKEVEGQSVQTGAGYAYSIDDGRSWTGLPQTLDSRGDSIVQYGNNTVRFLPIVVPEQNVTFDVALSDSAVWITSWSSGLRKSTDLGRTWQRIVIPKSTKSSIAPTDSLGYYEIDPREDNNFLMFAVAVENNDTVWAGSAGGINKSTDGGVSWVHFSRATQDHPILSDWVIAIAAQRFAGRTRIWTTNWPAAGPDQRFGISVSDDGGLSWRNFLHDVKAYDFAFKDSIVYVATDEGLFRSDDEGGSWIRSGSIVDPSNGQRITTQQFFAVDVLGDTVLAGTGDGFVSTIDNAAHPFGLSWQIRRTHQPLPNATATYAYPNPFSPRVENTRIHYSTGGRDASITIEIFDFGMNRVRTVLNQASRTGSSEHDDLWDGRAESGDPVPNGVYFYRVVVDDGEPSWGKIMVLQ